MTSPWFNFILTHFLINLKSTHLRIYWTLLHTQYYIQRVRQVQITLNKEGKIWNGHCRINEITHWELRCKRWKRGKVEKINLCDVRLFSCKWDITRTSFRSETVHSRISKIKNMWTHGFPLKLPINIKISRLK